MSFELIVLGCSGGPVENNLSGYLLRARPSDEYIALDAGALLGGIEIAQKRGTLPQMEYSKFLQTKVKGYLISHAHLDHILGLIINSQVDSSKQILASSVTIEALRDHIFNGAIWPNFGSEGNAALNLYQYVRMKEKKEHLGGMTIEIFPLNHSRHCPSSAFLIEYGGEYVLYFGDTSSDEGQELKHLESIWKRVAPYVRERRVKGILLECSYPADEKGAGVRSHLTTALMKKELSRLCEIAKSSLKGLKVVVTHRKEGFQRIATELMQDNALEIDYIFPVQGEKIEF